MNESGWRGSAEAWLDAAHAALLEGGVDAVRIQPIGRRMKLSRTSFYWFFKDREDLLASLVERWKGRNTPAIVARCEAYAETVVEAVLNVFDCWLDPALFDSQFEYAIRSWALQSPEVARAVDEADAVRLLALEALFARFGYPPEAADVRARTIYLAQIGYITMNPREDRAVRLRRVSHYVEVFTGRPVDRREMDRFLARHPADAARGVAGNGG